MRSCFLIIKIQVWSLSNGKTSSDAAAGTNVLANGREKTAAPTQQNPASLQLGYHLAQSVLGLRLFIFFYMYIFYLQF